MEEKEKRDLEAERNELNTLINRGTKFEVEETLLERQKGFFGFFKSRIRSKVKHTFVIQEPTLHVLDLITAESIEMLIDESVMSSKSGMSESKKIAKEHSKRCARVVALAVLGEEYVLAIPKSNGTVKIKYDDKRLKELTSLFFRAIKPSKLFKLAILVNTMMNLGDFMNSIRLMSGARTTMPNRIEEEQLG